MRNTVIGNYHVEDYLFAEDHPGLDEQDGYSNPLLVRDLHRMRN
jgi:hypothetical protein